MIDGAIGNLITAAIHLGSALICCWIANSTYPYFIALIWVCVVTSWVETDRLIFCNCNGVVNNYWLIIFSANCYVYLGGRGGAGFICNCVGKCFVGGLAPGNRIKFASG